VRLGVSSALGVERACIVETEILPIGTPSRDGAVVVVLAIVLPTALMTDLVDASFRKCLVAAAWARIEAGSGRREHVAHAGVRLEPRAPLSYEFFVGDVRIVVGTAYDLRHLNLPLAVDRSTENSVWTNSQSGIGASNPRRLPNEGVLIHLG